MAEPIDYFGEIEDAVIALVKNHLDHKDTYFDAPDEQVVKSDDDKLNEGHDYFFFTFPSAFPTVSAGTDVVETIWMIRIEIFTRFSTPESTWANFKAFRSDIFNLFNVRNIGRNLNRTPRVVSVLLSSEGEPIFYGEESTPSDPVFYSQAMQLSVSTHINRT